jgi:hypothetical protein
MTTEAQAQAREALLPCPFCGERNAVVLSPTCDRKTPYNPADRAFPVVRCASCDVEVPGKDWDQSCKSAIAAWNRRPHPDAPAGDHRCHECGEAVLYECPSCSASNYPEQPPGCAAQVDAPAGGEERVEAVAKAMQQSEQGAAGWTWEECSSIEVEGWKELARAALTAAGLPALVARVDSQDHELRDLVGESVEREAELSAWKQRAQQAESECDALVGGESIPVELCQWLEARNLMPGANEGGTVDASDIVAMLSAHESELAPGHDALLARVDALTKERDALAAEVGRLRAEVQRCHSRLEITHYFTNDSSAAGGWKRVEVTNHADRVRMTDGIEARDATIRGLEGVRKELVTKLRTAESRAQAAEGDAGRWRAVAAMDTVQAQAIFWNKSGRKERAKAVDAIIAARATQPEGESHE